MRRREYLAAAAGGTALLTAGVGTATADGSWWNPGNGDDGTPGDGQDEVVSTDFQVNEDSSVDGGPGADVSCNGTEVEVDGVIEVRDSCHTAALADVTFDGTTLTVNVAEAGSGTSEACLPVVTPVDYTATVTTSSAPDRVEVVHGGVSGGTFDHECAAGSDGTDTGTGSGTDTGSGWFGTGTSGSSGGDSGDGSDSSGGSGWW